MSKKKGGKKTQKDEDWDAFLNDAVQQNEKVTSAEPIAAPPPPVEAADEEDDSGEDDIPGNDPKKKKRRAKKGKKVEESSGPTAAAGKDKPKVLSAAAKAALERQRIVAEEEERIRKIREEEEARIRKLEEEEAEKQRKIMEEKERKERLRKEKIEAQKAAGTYMTKTEKEKLRKQQEKLEAMKKAGMINVSAIDSAVSSGPAVTGAALYRNNKKKQQPKKIDDEKKSEEVDEDVKNDTIPTEDDKEDDWEAAADKLDSISLSNTRDSIQSTAPVGVSATAVDDDDDWENDEVDLQQRKQEIQTQEILQAEDQIELDKRREQEQLKAAGIERQRREEENKRKREEEEKMREEMEKAERELLERKERSRKARLERDAAANARRSATNLRSPISCIMGHVDTGKTKLLDKIRHTNVQEGEAGGITQQIGATQFSRETLSIQTYSMQAVAPFEIKVPGLLMIDTPGHEAFQNLRSRGSSLCDIAVLVVDLMHGLEPQTIESINILKKRRTPFIVALNKVDRCYGWKTMPDSPIQLALAAQDDNVKFEFKDRCERAIVQLMEQGLNAKLYWENDDPGHTVSVVPTSAVSGEGVPDLIRLLLVLTQERMTERLMFTDALQCTVLEVKAIEGLGHTIDVVLVNGSLNEGDTIVVSTMDGPVVTNIRALLTPPPNREMRIKSEYVHHATIQGAIGVKIVAPDISRVVAGTSVLVVRPEDDVEDVKECVQSDIANLMKGLQTDHRGVTVHASTLGALEALLQFLREECKPPIPVSQVNIGPIHKKDVMRASIMHEKQLPEFATILAFDTGIDAEAREQAEELKVKVFFAEIIYHLFDQFSAYMRTFVEAKKAAASAVVVFPTVLKIFPNFVFNKKDPIVLGVEVMEGTLRLNTPLCVPNISLDVGRVTRMEINHKEVSVAKKGTQVAIRIENESNPTITFGRQFDHNNPLYSKISRQSIDACKEFFSE
jgi:translation initiation factor 5B